MGDYHRIAAFALLFACYGPAVPKTGGRRPLNMLISHEGHRALTERAKRETDGNVSELARRIFKYGLLKMPKGWK